MYATFEPKKNPWDEFTVPHFGEDEDIKATKVNLYAAEKKYNHELEASFTEPDGPKRNYFVPQFGEDTDITDSKKNLAQTEEKFGYKM